ncbi:hypothetical protein ACMGDH_10630 [Sphingomonas sp. DT-207]|uniref:hypothetical protein n=1 Tax=Sphingomonas sp. DT-207 TaxID=3396167 RepID=UPI003F1B6E62
MAKKAETAVVGKREQVSRPRRHLTVLAAVAGIVVSSGAGVSAGARQAAPSSAGMFHEQATKLGVKTCAGLYSALGGLVAQGAAHAVRTETDKRSPDTHIVQGAVGMTYDLPELKGQAAGVVIAAPRGQGCEGQFVRVAPFQKPCQQVVSYLPAGSVPVTNLSGVPLYEIGGGQGQAMLITSGASCVVVTITTGTQGP